MLTENRVDTEVGLYRVRILESRSKKIKIQASFSLSLSYLEDIKSGNGVNIRLLVGSVNLGSLFVDRGEERS